MTIRLSVLLFLFLAALAVCGQSATSGDEPKRDAAGPYLLKIREKSPGEKYEVSQTLTRTILSFQGNGKDKPPTTTAEKVTDRLAYTEEVIDAEDGVLTKCQRAYTKVALGEPENKDGHSIEGKVVAIERKADKSYSFTFADGKPVGQAASILRDEFASGPRKGLGKLLTNKPVRVGESWEVPDEKLLAFLGLPTLSKGTTATGKLVSAAINGGRHYGVISIHIEAPGDDQLPGGSIEATFDGCIDGSILDGTHKLVLTFRPRKRKKDANTPNVGGTGEIQDVVNTVETTVKQVK